MVLKVCGITRADDAAQAVEAGATALGFVFWDRSPRRVSVETAAAIVASLPASILTVGVFVNEVVDVVRHVLAQTRLTAVQLHGDEPVAYGDSLGCQLFRSMTLASVDDTCRAWPDRVTLLLDAADPIRRGGTGTVVDWDGAATAARRRRIVLAGGLTPENVGEAIARVRPYGVDVSSGVERAPGVKDPVKLTRFLTNARAAFERL